jgi:hypothetical protein
MGKSYSNKQDYKVVDYRNKKFSKKKFKKNNKKNQIVDTVPEPEFTEFYQ